MYIVIVGAGDVGTPLLKLATRSGNDVVVEQNEARAERAASNFDCRVINDDGTAKAVLKDAGADQADAVVTTTEADATNVMVCLLAQELDVPTVVSIVHNPEHMPLFRQIGVNTIENPQRLIAEYLYRAVKRPTIVDFMQIGDEAEIFEITVVEGAPIAGLTLDEAGKQGLTDEEILIVALDRQTDSKPITPRGDTQITEGDILTVYSATGATPAVTDIFGHYEDH